MDDRELEGLGEKGLYPCPFCTNIFLRTVETDESVHPAYVECYGCGARGPKRMNKEVARKHYNRVAAVVHGMREIILDTTRT